MAHTINIIAGRGIHESTFQILHDNQSGTGFCLTVEKSQFLITAAHIFAGKANKDVVQFGIFKDQKWNSIEGAIYLHQNKDVDIAIIPLPNYLTPPREIITDEAVAVGFQTFFFGFPYGQAGDGSIVNRGFPIPLVKRATISGFSTSSTGVYVVILDGHNNPGFSGGPIGHFDNDAKRMVVYGVVSSYVPQNNEMITPIGKIPYSENSGIMIGVGIVHALEIIKEINSPKK